ncbi:hypothetical protein [Prosthecobacter sp.]|uniref:hypothetical protein n=1 Tax=Prosthecobacter sp. TaxID=1965333 RepID=UPI0037847BB4
MIPYIMLVLALAAPVLLRLHGKRWLGNQTHPAAIFILAWMACAFLLGSVDFITISGGSLALVWVSMIFAAFALAARLRQKPAVLNTPTEDSKVP